jgi:hypothetical protein
MSKRKEKRIQKHFRVAESTPAKLSALAIALGYTYGKGAALGELLDAIAAGEVLLVAVPKNSTD